MEELDRLAAEFGARGYEPDGAEVDAPRDAAGHHAHDHGETPAPHAHGSLVRRFTHRGHEVAIATHYEISIDGRPWQGHLGVLDDGSVVYHGLPQYVVPSAVDLLRTLLDYDEDAPEGLREALRAAREEG